MKHKKQLIIGIILGTMLLTSCGSASGTDQTTATSEQTTEADQTAATTEQTTEAEQTAATAEQTTEAATNTTEATQQTESTEYADRKSILITATNECGVDIGMFSVIDPISGEQYNISAIEDGQSVSMPVEWPTEITDFQWALYNQNGELCVEATTDISQAENGVTLLLTGDGNLDNVQEIFE